MYYDTTNIEGLLNYLYKAPARGYPISHLLAHLWTCFRSPLILLALLETAFALLGCSAGSGEEVDLAQSAEGSTRVARPLGDHADRIIKRLTVSTALGDKAISELIAIGHQRGFEVNRAETAQLSEDLDPFLYDYGKALLDGRILFSAQTQPQALYAHRDASFLNFFDPYSRPDNGRFTSMPEAHRKLHNKWLMEVTQTQEHVVGRSLFQGGNIVVTECSKGRVAFVGRGDISTTATFLWHQRDNVGEPPLSERVPRINQNIKAYYARQLTNRSFAWDRYADNPAEFFGANYSELHATYDGYAKGSVFHPQPMDEYKSAQRAEEYLRSLHAAQETLARDLGLRSENIVSMIQYSYHVDLFLRPGPRGIVFFHQGNPQRPRSRSNTEVETIVGELIRSAGCQAVGIDGLTDSDKLDRKAIGDTQDNFFNGIMGWDLPSKEYYYITTSSPIVGRNEFLAQELKSHGISHVHFVHHSGLDNNNAGLECFVWLQANERPKNC